MGATKRQHSDSSTTRELKNRSVGDAPKSYSRAVATDLKVAIVPVKYQEERLDEDQEKKFLEALEGEIDNASDRGPTSSRGYAGSAPLTIRSGIPTIPTSVTVGTASEQNLDLQLELQPNLKSEPQLDLQSEQQLDVQSEPQLDLQSEPQLEPPSKEALEQHHQVSNDETNYCDEILKSLPTPSAPEPCPSSKSESSPNPSVPITTSCITPALSFPILYDALTNPHVENEEKLLTPKKNIFLPLYLFPL
ncbi:hypothetical protein TSAR_007111 [Trichomalopsis sarcophagae]|uniref:Uncharacterized protein n=1 Tax=Trichomalopsis sarcophagae TaxID=543379 RepID=A0A232EX21_9HYME|nr:hypothetical protein TSAR_007111 [Trichomalopsis sarcophagae]